MISYATSCIDIHLTKHVATICHTWMLNADDCYNYGNNKSNSCVSKYWWVE